jgi:hypothetical protein
MTKMLTSTMMKSPQLRREESPSAAKEPTKKPLKAKTVRNASSSEQRLPVTR